MARPGRGWQCPALRQCPSAARPALGGCCAPAPNCCLSQFKSLSLQVAFADRAAICSPFVDTCAVCLHRPFLPDLTLFLPDSLLAPGLSTCLPPGADSRHSPPVAIASARVGVALLHNFPCKDWMEAPECRMAQHAVGRAFRPRKQVFHESAVLAVLVLKCSQARRGGGPTPAAPIAARCRRCRNHSLYAASRPAATARRNSSNQRR